MNKDTEKAYYLTLFTLEGHKTWRAELGGSEESFEEKRKTNWGAHPTKILEKHVLRIDRITGQFTQLS